MNTNKHSIVGFLVFILFVSTILTSCGGGRENVYSRTPSLNFSELIGNENIDDISLTIYYMSPFILTRHPWSVDELINTNSVKEIVINSSELEEHFDLFNQINNDVLIPVKKKSYLNARLYYVLESRKNGKLFDVAMWCGDKNSIFVNGLEVNGNDIFYNIVKPFLAEDEVKELENYLAGIWPK